MHVLGGEGWRLRVEPERQPFPVLIGGRHWAAELTSEEALLFQFGIRRLQEQLEWMTPVLMPEESLELEHANEGLWLQLSGRPSCWSLRFVLEHQQSKGPARRGLEGGWSAEASMAFAAALLASPLPCHHDQSRMRLVTQNREDQYF